MKLKTWGLALCLAVSVLMISAASYADMSPSPSPSASMSMMGSPAPVAVVSADPQASVDFFAQVLNLIQNFGGLAWAARISAIALLIIASMKVSFMKPLWSKLGEAQVFAAPMIGIMMGVLSMKPFSWAGLLAYLGAGAGAIALHEIMDGVKAIPGIGASYVSMINFFEGILGGAANPPAQS